MVEFSLSYIQLASFYSLSGVTLHLRPVIRSRNQMFLSIVSGMMNFILMFYTNSINGAQLTYV